MAEVYVGAAVLEVDGREIEIRSLSVKEQTGRKPVDTMNSEGVVKGFAKGIRRYTLSVGAVKPIDGTEIDWAGISDAKVTVYPLDKDGQRTSYLNCFTLELGEEYSIDNEAVVNIEMQASRKIKE